MATSYTAKAKLPQPAANDRSWHTPLLALIALLDSLKPIGALAVTLHETPSTTLTVAISAGQFRSSTQALITYAGTASQALTASTTNYLYLTDAGVLTVNTTGFPTGGTYFCPLATVVTGATTITTIADARVPYASVHQ